MYHVPVLLNECLEGLNINPNGLYADVTFGGGGHSRAILDRLEGGHLYAFDQDADAAANAFDDERFTFIPHNFRYLKNFISLYSNEKLDGIFADLGVSSHQFDVAERGFSTRFNGRLDMRMDVTSPFDAASLVNTYDRDSIARVLRVYGELDNAYVLAGDIVAARDEEPIETTESLKKAVEARLPRGRENKTLAQIFQALRIEVNKEMEVLAMLLEQSAEMLKPGGRLVVLSYHSLEDRLVKNFMRAGNAEGEEKKDFFGNPLSPYKLITRKPIVPSEDEIERNSRARSARLRVAERRGA